MFVDAKETAFLHDLSKPSLEALSHVLRHKEMWPKGFEWGFGACDTCAMGLAGELWHIFQNEIGWRSNVATMARQFSMPLSDASNLFSGDTWAPHFDNGHCNVNHAAVTPDMVADEIDKYLASRAG